MKNCVLDETRYWIAFQLLCMHACGLLFLYLSHSSGPWKVDILFCTATVLLNPFPPLNLIFLTASFLNPLLLLLQFSCQWKAVSHWLFSGKRTQCLIGVNENYWGYFNWFCLRPLSLHQFGCLSNGKDKANLFFLSSHFPHKSFYWAGLQHGCQLPRSCPYFPISCCHWPNTQHVLTHWVGRKGRKALACVSLHIRHNGCQIPHDLILISTASNT